VIGAATAYELCKRGYKTLNIDKLPTSGYGPTSNSCAIVRAHYSSLEGVAMAYEGFAYWQDWERYLGAVDDMGTSKYMQCGTVLLKSATGHHEKVLTHYRDLGVEYEEWDNATSSRRSPSTPPTPSGRPGALTTRTSGTSRRASSTARSSPPARAT
jgi:sarcosine oxidase subunit beta